MTTSGSCPDCSPTLSRRSLLAGAAAVSAGLAATTLTTRVAFAAQGSAYTGDTLVVLSLRGGFDGLSAIVPLGDPAYAANRPHLQVRAAQALATGDRFWGLHPALAPLLPWWQDGTFGAVHAVASPSPTRSHFEATAELERAAPGSSIRTGWLDRALGLRAAGTAFEAISLRSLPPQAYAGPFQELGMGALSDFQLSGVWGEGAERARDSARWATALRALTAGTVLSGPGSRVLGALGTVGKITATAYQPANGAVYPHTVAGGPYSGSDLSGALAEVAQLIRAKVGLQVVCLDFGDWDMHTDLGTPDKGRFLTHLGELAASMQAFLTDLGPTGTQDVTVLTLSEFGRRVRENGSGGLDHGHGNAVLMFGGGVIGGRVHGSWPGLAAASLDQGDVAGRTDYRDLLAEVLTRRCAQPSVSRVFPGRGAFRTVGVVRKKSS